MTYDVEKIRADFPALQTTAHKKPLVFLDSAASAQKPKQVIDAMAAFYETSYANVHRGVYELSEKATDAFEAARRKIAAFIGAESENEIIFTRGATESLNLVAQTVSLARLKAGDEIIISQAEHHSNIVPWQLWRDRLGFKIKIAPVRDDGSFDFDAFKALLSDKTKLVSVMQVSNVLGTVFPIRDIVKAAHDAGALACVDGCQGVTHFPVDVRDTDCDFYAFSGHKLYGPTGIGVLYGKKSVLETLEPYQCGGDMIKSVSFDKSVWADLPAKFEAGTPAIVQAVGLGCAIDYLNALGMENVAAHEAVLAKKLTETLQNIRGVRLIGTARDKAGVASFVIDGVHPQDASMILDHTGIAVRTGHHCAQPLHERFGLTASIRASVGLYNTAQEIDVLAQGIEKAKKMFGV